MGVGKRTLMRIATYGLFSVFIYTFYVLSGSCRCLCSLVPMPSFVHTLSEGILNISAYKYSYYKLRAGSTVVASPFSPD